MEGGPQLYYMGLSLQKIISLEEDICFHCKKILPNISHSSHNFSDNNIEYVLTLFHKVYLQGKNITFNIDEEDKSNKIYQCINKLMKEESIISNKKKFIVYFEPYEKIKKMYGNGPFEFIFFRDPYSHLIYSLESCFIETKHKNKNVNNNQDYIIKFNSND